MSVSSVSSSESAALAQQLHAQASAAQAAAHNTAEAQAAANARRYNHHPVDETLSSQLAVSTAATAVPSTSLLDTTA